MKTYDMPADERRTWWTTRYNHLLDRRLPQVLEQVERANQEDQEPPGYYYLRDSLMSLTTMAEVVGDIDYLQTALRICRLMKQKAVPNTEGLLGWPSKAGIFEFLYEIRPATAMAYVARIARAIGTDRQKSKADRTIRWLRKNIVDRYQPIWEHKLLQFLEPGMWQDKCSHWALLNINLHLATGDAFYTERYASIVACFRDHWIKVDPNTGALYFQDRRLVAADYPYKRSHGLGFAGDDTAHTNVESQLVVLMVRMGLLPEQYMKHGAATVTQLLWNRSYDFPLIANGHRGENWGVQERGAWANGLIVPGWSLFGQANEQAQQVNCLIADWVEQRQPMWYGGPCPPNNYSAAYHNSVQGRLSLAAGIVWCDAFKNKPVVLISE